MHDSRTPVCRAGFIEMKLVVPPPSRSHASLSNHPSSVQNVASRRPTSAAVSEHESVDRPASWSGAEKMRRPSGRPAAQECDAQEWR